VHDLFKTRFIPAKVLKNWSPAKPAENRRNSYCAFLTLDPDGTPCFRGYAADDDGRRQPNGDTRDSVTSRRLSFHPGLTAIAPHNPAAFGSRRGSCERI
jgi:hypothetical protein